MRLRPLKPVILLFPILPLVLSLCNRSIAQTTASGGLTGVVTDPSSAVVPGSGVEIRDNAKGTTQATKTDREGVYRFFFLAPGRYALTVTRDGFRTESQAVTVPLGPPVTVNVTLEIAKENTTVKVTAEAPLIQAENGDVSTTTNQKQISEVPNPGNDLTYIVQTAPGALMSTDIQGLANFSILGMPGTSYLYTMDGMNDNDNSINLSQSGALFLLLGQNQIQEATVVSTGYSGQFGGAAGGNINYITKSGGNEFHGNAQYYWNGRLLNATDWFINALGKPRPFDNANQWAVSLGGPIKKDKLFFFFNTEGVRVLISNPNLVVIPSLEFEAATLANIDSDRTRFGPNSATDVAAVEGYEVPAPLVLKTQRLVQRHFDFAPSSFAGSSPARMVHQDLTHQPRCHSEEV
jgi:Carboxypeptidase regulatory-like domain